MDGILTESASAPQREYKDENVFGSVARKDNTIDTNRSDKKRYYFRECLSFMDFLGTIRTISFRKRF